MVSNFNVEIAPTLGGVLDTGTLINSIGYATSINGSYWTGFNTDGTAAGSDFTCQDWNVGTGLPDKAWIGTTSSTTGKSNWNWLGARVYRACDNEEYVVCACTHRD